MMFLLPAEIMDGILAGSALILIFMGYYGDKKSHSCMGCLDWIYKKGNQNESGIF